MVCRRESSFLCDFIFWVIYWNSQFLYFLYVSFNHWGLYTLFNRFYIVSLSLLYFPKFVVIPFLPSLPPPPILYQLIGKTKFIGIKLSSKVTSIISRFTTFRKISTCSDGNVVKRVLHCLSVFPMHWTSRSWSQVKWQERGDFKHKISQWPSPLPLWSWNLLEHVYMCLQVSS